MKPDRSFVLHGYLILNVAIVFALNAQTIVSIFPLKDNTLIEDTAGALSIGKSENFFVGRTAQATNSIRRGLIVFDIAADVPQVAIIDSVSLVLYMSQTQATSADIWLHRVSADWGEGESVVFGGQGTTADTGDATWIHTFHDTVFWTNVGGDFSIISSSSRIVGGIGFYVWESGQMDADVQDWLDDPVSNFGWILLGNEDSSKTVKRFDSRENSLDMNRPALTIYYTMPTVLNEVDVIKPREFYLEQNYPNPFNPSTKIKFVLPKADKVKIELYNTLGQRIELLLNQQMQAGQHEIDINAQHLSSGIYYYRIEAGEFQDVKKMVLLK